MFQGGCPTGGFPFPEQEERDGRADGSGTGILQVSGIPVRLLLFWLHFRSWTKDALGESREKGYLGSAKRKTPPPQKGQERQLKQYNSKASGN